VTIGPDYTEQLNVVTLNGTSVVSIPGTHLRFQRAIVLTVGSGYTNLGNITIRVASAGATQGYISALIPGTSHAYTYFVPAGKQLLIYNFSINGAVIGGPAGGGCRIIPTIWPFSGAKIIGLPFHTTNSPSMITLPTPFTLAEKTQFSIFIDSVSGNGMGVSIGTTCVLRNI
jgi:hypothetical protein